MSRRTMRRPHREKASVSRQRQDVRLQEQVAEAIHLVSASLGAMVRDIRQRQGDLSQERLGSELSKYGFRMDQQSVSRVENGRVPYVHRLKLQVWLKQCGLELTSPEARGVLEFRELAQWFCELSEVVPDRISATDYGMLATVVSDFSARAATDTRAFRHLLQRSVEDLVEQRRPSKFADLDWWGPSAKGRRRFAGLYGLWKGKVDLSFEEIQGAEIRLRAEI